MEKCLGSQEPIGNPDIKEEGINQFYPLINLANFLTAMTSARTGGWQGSISSTSHSPSKREFWLLIFSAVLLFMDHLPRGVWDERISLHQYDNGCSDENYVVGVNANPQNDGKYF